ncbi:MAG: acylphosphatase [Candidatus Omnitrophota bacterium]
MQKRYHLFFTGSVQGVGFRYTARALAEKYSINGWVANLTDGRVELEIEGKESDIDNFLSDLGGEFKNYLSKTQKEELTPLNQSNGFHIKFIQ